MSSPCRTTSLLVSKESDGWITYKSREKEDTLSLKPNENGYWIFFLFFLLTFGLLLCFILPFAFFFFFSFLISFPFHLSSFSLLFLALFLTLFGATTHPVKGRKLPPHFLKLKVWLSLFHISFSYFLMTSSPHGFIWAMEFLFPHMAHCEPFFQVDHMALPMDHMALPSVTLLWCHMASPYLAMCHPTPHVSKNVKSQPPRNLPKFDVVAQFRETISTENSVSSSEI